MEKSKNSPEVEPLYDEVCAIMKRYGSNGISVPSKEKFRNTLKVFNALLEGHKSLLFAIGRL